MEQRLLHSAQPCARRSSKARAQVGSRAPHEGRALGRKAEKVLAGEKGLVVFPAGVACRSGGLAK